MLSLLVFDLDGTLVDSHRDLADATNALLEELGGRALRHGVVTGFVGDGAAVLVRRALTHAGIDPDTPGALDRFLEHYDRRLLDTTKPYDGMLEALTALGPGRRLAVLTNKPSRATSRVLAGLGLEDRFADVIGGDTAYGRKPDPRGLLALVARAGVTPDHTLLVGDSPVDLATARHAGVRMCVARYGFGYRFDGSEFDGHESFIDAPTDLIETVRRLENA
jgi:phosphoglycolate phosphatase